MRYQLVWGGKQALLDSIPEEDRPEVPSLLPWAETPWRAWQELSADRAYTVSGYSVPMGGMMLHSNPCPIPWTAVAAWCDRAGCDSEERTEFIAPILAALDREFIEHTVRQRTVTRGTLPDNKLARWDAED